MKKLDIFVLFLIAAMVMPATMQAGKIKYGKGLIYEGNHPGKGTLTCGNLVVTGDFEGWMHKSSEKFKVAVLDCKLSGTTVDGEEISFEGKGSWEKSVFKHKGGPYHFIMNEGRLTYNGIVLTGTNNYIWLALSEDGTCWVLRKNIAYWEKTPVSIDEVKPCDGNFIPKPFPIFEGTSPCHVYRYIHDQLQGGAGAIYNKKVEYEKCAIEYESGLIAYYSLDKNRVQVDYFTKLENPRGDYYNRPQGGGVNETLKRTYDDGTIIADGKESAHTTQDGLGNKDRTTAYTHIFINYKDGSTFDGGIWDSKHSECFALTNPEFIKTLFNGTKIKNLNLKLHGVLVSPDGKESMYYKGKPYNEYKEKFDRDIANNRSARLKAENKVKDKYKALRAKYNQKYGANVVTQVVGKNEQLCTPIYSFDIPVGTPWALIPELKADLDVVNKLIDKTNNEVRKELGNDKAIDFSRDFPMHYITWEERIPLTNAQIRYGRNVKLYIVTCLSSNMGSSQCAVYVVNGKVVGASR